MLANAKTLGVGIITGVLLAVLLPYTTHLPSDDFSRNGGLGSTSHDFLDTMALSLSKPLRMAQQTWRRAAYKSCRFAPSLPFCQQQTPISRLPTPTLDSTSRTLFSTTSATMASTKSFLDAVKDRRSIYQLNKEAPKSDKEIVDLVNQIVLHVPSSFNSQSSRLVVLLNEEHEKFWDITKDVLEPQVPEEQFKSGTVPKLNGFKGAYGTVSITGLPPKCPSNFSPGDFVKHGVVAVNMQPRRRLSLAPLAHASPTTVIASAPSHPTKAAQSHAQRTTNISPRSFSSRTPSPSRIFARPSPFTRTTLATGKFSTSPHNRLELISSIRSEHTSAMHQFAAWTALEAEGFGANLQHYNPLVDQKIQNEWDVPQQWKLRAQLVFGGRAGEAGEKKFKPLEERVFVHGAKN
jgi:predicted oxidoreductase (fatty acid repression mutant protein)